MRVSSTNFITDESGAFRNALNLQEERAEGLAPDVTLHCPVCGARAVLKDSRAIYGVFHGFVWACPNLAICDTYVGCHRNSHSPLGTLADAPTRRARGRAHRLFDSIWKSGRLSRKDAYRLLQQKMGLSERDAHIAKFTLSQCNKLCDIFMGEF